MEVACDAGLAGVTDRGLRHHRNEDAMALRRVGQAALAVVCDGVSTTQRPDEASQLAADAALAVLGDAVTECGAALAAGSAAALDEISARLEAAMVTAVQAAQAAVLTLSYVPAEQAGGYGAPSATMVAAVALPEVGRLVVGWVGDSRAAWLTTAGARALTTDHSWAAEVVAAGLMEEAAALADPRAHVITRWLGADLPEPRPDVATVIVDGPGLLLVCSDGLWNYADTPDALHALVGPAGVTTEAPLDLTRRLVDFARAAGGHDNITVVAATVNTGNTGSAVNADNAVNADKAVKASDAGNLTVPNPATPGGL